MKRKNCKGFSLLEIMLVCVLLGVIATLAISVLPEHSSLQQEEERLLSRLHWANERAIRDGQIYGLVVSAHEWQLVKLVVASSGEYPSYYWPGRYWQPADDPIMPKRHTLPTAISLQLMLTEIEQSLTDDLQRQGLEPQIMFMPGGEVSRFTLRLLADDQPAREIKFSPGETV